jgi:uncharacterized membrane protein YqjE
VTTLLASLGFSGWLGFLYLRHHASFPVLARAYLWIAPFLPLVGLLNHNIDRDRFSAPVMLFPMYVLIVLLACSLIEWSRALRFLRPGTAETFLGLYALMTILQVPFSIDPLWSLSAWTWSVPGYGLFLLAGRFTTRETLADTRGPFIAIAGFIGVNMSLIAYGLLTGRADSLFLTRNFGSFYASTAMLLFLSLFAGLAWYGIAYSRLHRSLFFLGSLLALAFSFSRTALMMLPLYAVFVRDRSRRALAGRARVALLTLLGAVAAYWALSQSEMATELARTWDQRFSGWQLWESFTDASRVRSEEFSVYRERIRNETLLVGWGFGTFRYFSQYADAHNLFVTEAFENGLLAAVVLLLSFSIPLAVWALRDRARRPLAASILTFLLIAHLTGGMLSNRAPGQYYSALPGWALFFLIGCLRSAADEDTENDDGDPDRDAELEAPAP